jgi:hypothetical protein
MLVGTADVEELAARAPTMESLDAEEVVLEGVESLQATFQMAMAAREATLPPGLHPTEPPMLVVQAWQVTGSPWGPFAMAQVRVSCRSGVRPRGLVAGCVVDSEGVAKTLASTYGFPAQAGEVRLDRRYHATELAVSVGGQSAMVLRGLGPDPLAVSDVQHTVTMTLAHTPRGLRLVQVDADHALERVERVRPTMQQFDASAWGQPALAPTSPIAATVALGSITIPKLRYLCRPDVLAFQGTESV